jgi:hypothetical protein
MKTLLFWLPRVVSIAFILFISIFALDVFQDPNWPLALFMHLIPSLVLTFLTVIAWKNEMLGGLLFSGIGIFFLISSNFEAMIIALPAILIGMLYFVSGAVTNNESALKKQ